MRINILRMRKVSFESLLSIRVFALHFTFILSNDSGSEKPRADKTVHQNFLSEIFFFFFFFFFFLVVKIFSIFK